MALDRRILAAIFGRRRRQTGPEFNAFWHADFWVAGFWVDNFWAES